MAEPRDDTGAFGVIHKFLNAPFRFRDKPHPAAKAGTSAQVSSYPQEFLRRPL